MKEIVKEVTGFDFNSVGDDADALKKRRNWEFYLEKTKLILSLEY